MTAEEIRAARRAAPPKEVRLLLPVWGADFVAQFLNFLLPTLLASDNIPAVAAEIPLRFIALSSSGTVDAIRGHAAWQRLAQVCTAELKVADDLITSTGSASTTVTLAFEREVRAVGDAMTDTAFIFLTPDYIMANGSLLSLWRRMQDGASGIQAGNFQVLADAVKFDRIPGVSLQWAAAPRGQGAAPAAEPPLPRTAAVASLTEKRGRAPTGNAARRGIVAVAKIPPRELVTFSLRHLHPVTVGNTVNFLASHNVHTNRLFWRVDGKTLIGRFYLMHMICIRPEITDFQIGSSCDYSFIPEMCPSGNVDVMTDSDDYFVVEAQPHSHELKFSRFGRMRPTSLARSLSEWTTDHHRTNARHTLVFHGGKIPARIDEVKAEADTFIASVTAELLEPAQPVRGHPYWRHAAAYSHFFTGKQFSQDDYEALLTPISGPRSWLAEFGERFWRFVMSGRPMLEPWQPRWMDFRALKRRLRRSLRGDGKNVLLVTSEPLRYLEWAHRLSSRLVVSYPWHFSAQSPEDSVKWDTRFDVMIVELEEQDLDAETSVNRIAEAAAPGAELLVLVRNQRRRRRGEFNRMITASLDLLQPTEAEHLFAHFVKLNKARWTIDRLIEQLATTCRRHSKVIPVVMPICVLLMPVAMLMNAVSLLLAPIRWPVQRYSSVLFAFRVSESSDD